MGKIREKFSGPVEDYDDVTLYGGVPPTANVYSVNPYLQSYYFKHSRGENIPDFHKRKARGELLPFTNWYQWEAQGEATGDLKIHRNSDNFTHFYSPDGSYTYIPDWNVSSSTVTNYANSMLPSQDVYAQFITAAASKIYSKGWDALTFLAELHKTIGMFRRLAQRTVKQAVTGELEKSWLESRYGWRLLIYDIEDIMNLINSLDSHRQRYSDRVGQTWSETTTWTYNYTSSLYNAEIRFSDTVEVGARGSIVADISPPKIALNPITTAWELIPYSFVLDWFVNVGQFLESMSFLAMAHKHFASAGFQCRVVRETVGNDVTWTDPSWTVDIHNFESLSEGVLTIRHPESVPYRPSIHLNLTPAKVADLGALVGQTMLKKYRGLAGALSLSALLLAKEEATKGE